MVTISKSISVVQIILTFSITCGNHISHYYNNSTDTDTPQLLSTLVQIGKSDLHLQHLHFDLQQKLKKPNSTLITEGATKRAQKDEKATFTCVCTSPLELNATLVVPWPLQAAGGSNQPISWSGAFAYFKILQCPKSNIVCRKWKTTETVNTNRICQDYAEKKEAAARNKNVTEVRSNSSCIIITNGKVLGRVENADKKMSWDKKTDHQIPTLKKNRSKIAIVVYRNSTLPLSNNSKIFRMDSPVPNSRSLINQQTDRFQTIRIRRSSTISLKPMIFPYLSRNLVERKRNNSKYEAVEADAAITTDGTGNVIVMSIRTQNPSLPQELLSVPETRHDDYIRRKREMHVMVARYRKGIKRSRKKRPRKNDCDDRVKKVSTTPYTFLNVSFTGYWEREERTTVRPRVQRPLKTSEYDINWVYGGSGYEKGREKGRNKGKSGRSSHSSSKSKKSYSALKPLKKRELQSKRK